MAKLDKVIQIGNQEYEVQAKSAEHVEHKLVVNQVGLDGTTLQDPIVEFDGSGVADSSFEIVATTGGKFKGPIRVPNAIDTNDDEESNINTDGTDFCDDAVLNYSDIKNNVLSKLLNTSVLYNWNGSDLNPVINKAINGISLVAGNDEDLTSFAEKNNTNTDKKLSAYLYISTDAGYLYFGTDGSEEPLRIAGSSDFSSVASQLLTARSLITNLGSTTAASFNGTADVKLGVEGVLPVSKGGTGSTTLTNITVGTANTLRDATDGRVSATAEDVLKNTNDIKAIVDGTTKVAKAAAADSAATLGIYNAGHFQKKITIQQGGSPSGGAEGDICIIWN